MILRSEGSPDARRYNRPTTSEIGVLYHPIILKHDNKNT
ncbi:hypothetical protein INT46_000689 [Mucor plumbeus]|uniref:Uncharacterized protein n=1 Tax=Mucor plumbeus TaxID=97098 RepID=A0A8H7QJ90_9FUNG|nr:hypothetical protein INT46_000689 [Mucor plumbeus]